MALGALLEEIREHYVSHFIAAVQELTVSSDASVAHECALRDEDGDVVTDGVLDLPMRGDAVSVRDGVVVDSVQVDTETMVSFDPVEFDWPEGDLPVELAPFQWNWLQLRLQGGADEMDWAPLRQWFLQWFGADDPAPDALLGGVHYLSEPEQGDGWVQLSADLGTAPVQAFEELLDAVAAAGATALHAGQFDEEEES